MNYLYAFILIFSGFILITILHTFVMAVVGRLLGGDIEEFAVGVGPRLLGFDYGDMVIRLNWLPLGGYVKFDEYFAELKPLRQIIEALSGNLVLILVALAIFGLSDGFGKFASGFYQTIIGAIAPLSTGKNLVGQLFAFAENNSFLTLFALMSAKLAAYNLLPFGSLNGGFIIVNVLKMVFRLSEKAVERYSLISLLVMVLLMIAWFVALVGFLLS